MNLQLIVLFLLLIFVPFETTKILSNIKYSYKPGARCLIQAPKHFNVDSPINPFMLRRFIKDLLNFLHMNKVNCSFSYIENIDFGSPNENGSYNGLIGMVQHGQQDVAMILVRPDSLPYEPGKVTPTFFPADVTIVSRRNESKKISYEFIKVLDFDMTIYIYFLTCLFFFFGCSYSFCEIVFSDKTTCKNFFQKYLNTVREAIDLVIDQETFSPSSMTGRVLSISACLFCFFAIYGILFNNISADMVVNIKPPVIDSLEDLLDHPVKPYMTKNTFIHSSLKSSPKGSKLHELWLKVSASNNDLMTLDELSSPKSLNITTNILDDIVQSKKAMILPNYFSETWSKLLICMFYPKESSKLYQASQLFAPGMLTSLMNPKIDLYTEKIFTYMLTTLLETDLLKGGVQIMAKDAPVLMNIDSRENKYNRRVIQCVEQRNEDQLAEMGFSPLRAKNLSKVFRIYFVMTIFAFILNICESFYLVFIEQ